MAVCKFNGNVKEELDSTLSPQFFTAKSQLTHTGYNSWTERKYTISKRTFFVQIDQNQLYHLTVHFWLMLSVLYINVFVQNHNEFQFLWFICKDCYTDSRSCLFNITVESAAIFSFSVHFLKHQIIEQQFSVSIKIVFMAHFEWYNEAAWNH